MLKDGEWERWERSISFIPANPADVGSIDAILAAVYDVISGPAGEKRLGANAFAIHTWRTPYSHWTASGRRLRFSRFDG
jgi:hypothetical protein